MPYAHDGTPRQRWQFSIEHLVPLFCSPIFPNIGSVPFFSLRGTIEPFGAGHSYSSVKRTFGAVVYEDATIKDITADQRKKSLGS